MQGALKKYRSIHCLQKGGGGGWAGGISVGGATVVLYAFLYIHKNSTVEIQEWVMSVIPVTSHFHPYICNNKIFVTTIYAYIRHDHE